MSRYPPTRIVVSELHIIIVHHTQTTSHHPHPSWLPHLTTLQLVQASGRLSNKELTTNPIQIRVIPESQRIISRGAKSTSKR